MKQDSIYSQPRNQVVDFAFDDAVVDVFPDMIRRSVPGYETLISMLGTLSRHYTQANSTIYDLGCSLGAATLSMYRQVQQPNVRYIGVDNAPAMVAKCKKNLQKHMPDSQHEVLCKDIQTASIENASVVVINFTLQFLPINERQALLKKAYQGLLPGGCLILSEKIQFEHTEKQTLITDWHHTFKRANHYSEMEISQKRAALDNVLIPETSETHLLRLKECGFTQAEQWFQCFSFASFLALKQA